MDPGDILLPGINIPNDPYRACRAGFNKTGRTRALEAVDGAWHAIVPESGWGLLPKGVVREQLIRHSRREERTMNEQVFQERFSQLLKRINALPDAQKVGLAVPAADPNGQEADVTRAVNELQDSLDFLRLSVKYLMFDLEATRRENGYLRRLLEQATQQDRHTNDCEDNYYRDEEDD